MKKPLFLILMFSILGLVVSIYAETIPTKGYVSAKSGLNVRKGPSSSSTKIGALNTGQNVTIESVSGKWYKISSPMSGYVFSQHIVVTDSREVEDEDDSKLSPEEADKVGCDLDKSLSNVVIMKTPKAN